jgi:hypothetical protein
VLRSSIIDWNAIYTGVADFQKSLEANPQIVLRNTPRSSLSKSFSTDHPIPTMVLLLITIISPISFKVLLGLPSAVETTPLNVEKISDSVQEYGNIFLFKLCFEVKSN